MPIRRWLSCLIVLCFFAFTLVGASVADDAVVIKMSVLPGMKFDQPRFLVQPGAKVRIEFRNPDTMQHNLAILEPGSRVEVVNLALALGGDGPAKSYIPETPKILHHTPILDPGKSATLEFTAPKKKGAYPYVCTFPGHGYIMFGAMYVGDANQKLPSLDKDEEVSPLWKSDASQPRVPHKYHAAGAMVQRIFMPDCGPAAIAVGLTDKHAYCFDAGACRLRYAWTGGFVDATEHWAGNGSKLPSPVGIVYYRAGFDFPIRLGDPAKKAAKVKWRGYSLVKGVPEFSYEVDGVLIRERIEAAGEDSLVRHFAIDSLGAPLYFELQKNAGVTWSASAGKVDGDVLKLTAEEGKQFSVTMKRNPTAPPPAPLPPPPPMKDESDEVEP